MIYAQLFFVFLKIGLFAVGGAYSFIPLLEKDIVEKYHWLTTPEFLDVLGMVNFFPGAISIKYSTYVGYKMGGMPGAIAANIGNLLGPFLMVLCVASFYNKYRNVPAVKEAFKFIQVAVFALIISAAFKLVDISQLMNLRSGIIIVICFSLFLYSKVNPAAIIISAGIIGAFFSKFNI